MSLPKQIVVKESMAELRKLQKNSIPMIANRIRALIEFKKHSASGISKREVADIVGVNHNSVQTWRSKYINGGIEAILNYDKRDGRPSVFTKAEHEKIAQKLNDPQNGICGYIELLHWVEEEFRKTVHYNTLLKYSQRMFGSSIKVARKSHSKKDDEAVAAFKKTSLKNASTSSSKPTRSIKK